MVRLPPFYLQSTFYLNMGMVFYLHFRSILNEHVVMGVVRKDNGSIDLSAAMQAFNMGFVRFLKIIRTALRTNNFLIIDVKVFHT